MKICRIISRGKLCYAREIEGRIYPFDAGVNIGDLDLSAEFDESENASDFEFVPPLTPSKIVCVGRNYADHAAELGNEVPAEPLLFLKAPSAIITEGDAIILPDQSERVEHEGELGIVIGKHCKNLAPQTDPLQYVFGYVCLNDITARDLQKKDIQFTRAKSFDTFCPVGRFIETDLDTSDLYISTKVNGIVRQESKTSRMVFDIPFLLRYISNQMTLSSGDLIATGTPSGVSKLEKGDSVEVFIDGIGNLSNPVR